VYSPLIQNPSSTPGKTIFLIIHKSHFAKLAGQRKAEKSKDKKIAKAKGPTKKNIRARKKNIYISRRF